MSALDVFVFLLLIGCIVAVGEVSARDGKVLQTALDYLRTWKIFRAEAKAP